MGTDVPLPQGVPVGPPPIFTGGKPIGTPTPFGPAGPSAAPAFFPSPPLQAPINPGVPGGVGAGVPLPPMVPQSAPPLGTIDSPFASQSPGFKDGGGLEGLAAILGGGGPQGPLGQTANPQMQQLLQQILQGQLGFGQGGPFGGIGVNPGRPDIA